MLPQATAERHVHNVRSKENLSQPNANTVQTQRSFFPATTRLWNNLDPGVRSTRTLETFKETFKREKKRTEHFDSCPREGQILLARLWLKNSDLNANLYSINLSDTPKCACGANEETTNHYLNAVI